MVSHPYFFPSAGVSRSRTTDDAPLIAAALTAGLAAYFLGLARLDRLHNDDGTRVDGTPLGIKNFMMAQTHSRFGRNYKGIFNAIDPGHEFCYWNEGQVSPLSRRQDEGPQCVVPSPSTSVSSSSPESSSPAESTTTTESASSAEPTTGATDSPSGPTISLPPSVGQALSCHDEADFPGHAEIKEATVGYYAGAATSRWTGYRYGVSLITSQTCAKATRLTMVRNTLRLTRHQVGPQQSETLTHLSAKRSQLLLLGRVVRGL